MAPRTIGEFKPDLLINAADIGQVQAAFESVLPYLKWDCMLADIATIKGKLPFFYRDVGLPFVSVHPMFGPNLANLDQLDGQNGIIISESDEQGKGFFNDFFSELKLSVHHFSFHRHDELMALSLALPFSASIAFSACAEHFTIPGTTYAGHREIARKLFLEDNSLLTEVLFNEGSVHQIERIVSKLEHLKHIIRASDEEEAFRFLDGLRAKFRQD